MRRTRIKANEEIKICKKRKFGRRKMEQEFSNNVSSMRKETETLLLAAITHLSFKISELLNTLSLGYVYVVSYSGQDSLFDEREREIRTHTYVWDSRERRCY